MKKNKLLVLGLTSLLGLGVYQCLDNADLFTKAETNYTEADRDIETGYLLREDFSPYPTAYSGWEKYNMPGNTPLKTVKSSNTNLETYIKKDFVEQSGEITIDISVTLAADISRGYLTILGNYKGVENKAIVIRVEANKLYYVTSTGDKEYISDLSFDYTTGLRIKASAKDNKCSISIDGKAIETIQNLELSDTTDALSGVKFGIDKSETGGFAFSKVSIRKGFDVFEDMTLVGINDIKDKDYDYNRDFASINCTVNDHTIQNDNNALAHLACDGDDSTYWYHNSDLTITKNVYFMVKYSTPIQVDTIRLKFHSAYKGAIEVSACSPSGAWAGVGKAEGMNFRNVDANASNDYTYTASTKTPVTCAELAIGFVINGSGYNISSGIIELSSFNAYCKNPIVHDINTYPTDWERVTPNQTKITNTTYSGDHVFGFIDNNLNDSSSTSVALDRKGSIDAEFSVCYLDTSNGNKTLLVNQNGDSIGIETKKKVLNLAITEAGTTTYVPIQNAENKLDKYQTGIWNNLILKYNEENNTANVVYNGWNPIEPVELPNSFKNSTWKKFEFVTSPSFTTYYADNIKIYKPIAESDCPEIQAADTGDTIVTMQVCSLWREGTHTNWGVLDYEGCYDRQPILGYYDEGTPAVADWEIKIAKEHGISNMMFCWYRKGEGAIKDSNYSDAIWDGLFKSKFKDQMNFSLMLENGSSRVNGISDLLDNIMPYYINTFFKNPNYQKTADGKPILYVYQGDMLSTIGDVTNDGKVDKEDMLYATNKMRELCVEAGFPGLYISAELRSASSTLVRSLESYGYDSIFSYTWSSGVYNVNDDYTLGYSEGMMLQQEAAFNTDTFSVIPNISKSWDPKAWMDCGFNGASATYMYDLEHYREFCLWVKDVFTDCYIDSSGTKMVMLDNWNEYSEGHWLMPTNGTPAYKNGMYAYGYLDIIREVFGINDFEHTDHLPLQEGYGPFDTWYPAGWTEGINRYVELYGEAQDNSVVDEEIIDWQIGYDTLGGHTEYIKAVDGKLDNLVLSLKESNRVVLYKEVVAELKKANGSLTVEMLNGTISLTKEEVAKLNVNKSLEIVINELNDVSDYAIMLRKSTNYYLADGAVIDYSIKQGGYEASIAATLKLNSTPKHYSGYLLLTNELSTLKSDANIVLEGSAKIIFVK